MKANSVVILELNKAVLTQLQEAFEESKEFSVLYTGDDGDEGMKQILQMKPDLIIVGMFLKGTDGCGVIRAVKKSWPEAKIVVTGSANDTLIERAMEEGAIYYLVKPFTIATALERFTDLMKSKPIGVHSTTINKRKPVTLEEKISEIFISIGIPPHIKGYLFLRDGIKLVVDDPLIINSITRRLYPAIAKKYDTTPSKVERAIRHAIEVAWSRGKIDNINNLFGVKVYSANEKPTNGEFIALLADKMLLEGA